MWQAIYDKWAKTRDALIPEGMPFSEFARGTRRGPLRMTGRQIRDIYQQAAGMLAPGRGREDYLLAQKQLRRLS